MLCDVKVSDCQIWSVGNVQWDNNQVKDSQELLRMLQLASKTKGGAPLCLGDVLALVRHRMH